MIALKSCDGLTKSVCMLKIELRLLKIDFAQAFKLFLGCLVLKMYYIGPFLGIAEGCPSMSAGFQSIGIFQVIRQQINWQGRIN